MIDVSFFDLSTVLVTKRTSFISLKFNGNIHKITGLIDKTINIYIDTPEQAHEIIKAGQEALQLLEKEKGNTYGKHKEKRININ